MKLSSKEKILKQSHLITDLYNVFKLIQKKTGGGVFNTNNLIPNLQRNINYTIIEQLNILEKANDYETMFNILGGSIFSSTMNSLKSIMYVQDEYFKKILEVKNYLTFGGVINDAAVIYIYIDEDNLIPLIFIQDETYNFRKDFTIYINIEYISNQAGEIKTIEVYTDNNRRNKLSSFNMVKYSRTYMSIMAIQGYHIDNYDANIQEILHTLKINRSWSHTLHSFYSTFVYLLYRMLGVYSIYNGNISINGIEYAEITNDNASMILPITFYGNERRYNVKFFDNNSDNLFYLVLFLVSLIQTNQVNS